MLWSRLHENAWVPSRPVVDAQERRVPKLWYGKEVKHTQSADSLITLFQQELMEFRRCSEVDKLEPCEGEGETPLKVTH